jgi:hypothetical protein
LGRVFSFQLQPFASGGRHLIHILLGSGDNLDVVAKKQHAVPPGIELLLRSLQSVPVLAAELVQLIFALCVPSNGGRGECDGGDGDSNKVRVRK